MTKRAKCFLTFCLALAGFFVGAVLVYALLLGPLLPFSPVKPGFDELKLGRCSLFYPRGSTPDAAYLQLDNLMKDAEEFHRLTFKKNVRVIICGTDSQYRRISRAGGQANTMQTGTVICVRPSIADAVYAPRIDHQNGQLALLPPANHANRDLVGFLKHELSHAILYQNTTLWKAMKFNRWIEEGLAVYFGNAHHYYGGADLRMLAIDDGFWFSFTREDAGPNGIPQEIIHFFSYGTYCGFISYLIDTYGCERVIDFVHAYVREPNNEQGVFQSRFDVTLNEAVEAYRHWLAAAQ